MHLHEAARAIDASAIGADVALGAVSSDSRNLPPGCLFVALKGPRFDGHAFAAQALANGAAAVMVAADSGLACPAPGSPKPGNAPPGGLRSRWRAALTNPACSLRVQ